MATVKPRPTSKSSGAKSTASTLMSIFTGTRSLRSPRASQRFRPHCSTVFAMTQQRISNRRIYTLCDNSDNRDDLYDTSVDCHGCLYHGRSRPCCERSEPKEASACGCGFEGMGSEIPIKYASQVNCESNLFDVAYLALGE